MQVGPGTLSLSTKLWPQLSALVGKPMAPTALLRALSRQGLHLLPEDRDAEFAQTLPKEAEVEAAMCRCADLRHIRKNGLWRHAGLG